MIENLDIAIGMSSGIPLIVTIATLSKYHLRLLSRKSQRPLSSLGAAVTRGKALKDQDIVFSYTTITESNNEGV